MRRFLNLIYYSLQRQNKSAALKGVALDGTEQKAGLAQISQ